MVTIKTSKGKKAIKNVIGIIHARGGSKRIPLKNIKLLAGKPLIAYMIEAALKAKSLNRVIVSSDHPDILRIAKECGAEVPFVRPKDLAEDVASELVTQHAVQFLEEKDKMTVDIAVTLQPTAPFCQPEDIDGCVQTLIDADDIDSAITAVAIRERPEWMFYLDKDSHAKLLLNKEIKGDAGVSQNLPRMYLPNGAAYATWRDVLFRKNTIFGDKIKLWIMSKEASVDIDDPIDFEFAEFLARKLQKASVGV